MWDTTWVVATDSALMSVRVLLPDPVTVTDDSTAFLLEAEDTAIVRSLADFCGQPCRDADGTTAPKPAFNGLVTNTVDLHDDLDGFTAGSGELRVRLSHDFGFDPIRPAGGGTGRIEVTVRSAGAVVGTAVLDGAAETFPSGSARVGTIGLAGAELGSGIELETRIESPAGAATAIDADARLTIEPTLEAVSGTMAAIRVRKEVTIEQAEMDFRDVDSTVVRHLREGGLRFEIHNPWPISGQLTLLIRTPSGDIGKTFQLEEGVSEARVTITEAQIQSIVGSMVTFDAAGLAMDAGQAFNVAPDEYLVIYPEVEATIRIGEVEP
jgi:hypothetical protein